MSAAGILSPTWPASKGVEGTIATILLEIGLGAVGEKDTPRSPESATRLVEALGKSACSLCQITARVEAAAPLPARCAVWIADALRDHADPHIAVMDQPGLLLGGEYDQHQDGAVSR